MSSPLEYYFFVLQDYNKKCMLCNNKRGGYDLCEDNNDECYIFRDSNIKYN